MIEIADYSNVTFTGNWFTAADGTPSYFPNTVYIPCITLQGVDTASIVNNVCANAWDVWDTTNWQFQATDFPTTSGVTACGNVYGLVLPMTPVVGLQPAAAPLFDANCS
jgi:hypothetical protein